MYTTSSFIYLLNDYWVIPQVWKWSWIQFSSHMGSPFPVTKLNFLWVIEEISPRGKNIIYSFKILLSTYCMLRNMLSYMLWYKCCECVCVCVLSHFHHVQFFVTPSTIAHQAPLFMGFSQQEYWHRLPCPPLGELPNPGTKPTSPALQVDSLLAEPRGKPQYNCYEAKNRLNIPT